MRRASCAVVLFVAAACGGHHGNREPAAPGQASIASRPKKVIAAFALPAPVLGITTPMAGEPDPKALDESRLVTTSCQKVWTEDIEAEIKKMRAAVDASFMDWVHEQPACWAAMREEWRAQQEMMRLQREAAARGEFWGYGTGSGYGALGAGIAGTIAYGAGTGESRGVAHAKDYSRTNNQIANVDEADLVKTDGQYVYLASNGALRIIEALAPKVLSVTPVPGVVREMFLEGDRAVVYSAGAGAPAPRCTYGYDCAFRGDGTTTEISVLDVKDRKRPVMVRHMVLSGSLMAARRIGNAVHTVVADNDAPGPAWHAWPPDLDRCRVPQATVNARVAQLKADNEKAIRARPTQMPTVTEKGKSTPMCQSVMRTASGDGKAFTSVVSFDMTNDAAAPVVATMRSRPGAVFASDTGLYVAVTRQQGSARSYYPAEREVSEIHKFRIGASPAQTQYAGSGAVPGHVLSQFAMDEWYGYLRVATTKGRVPDPSAESAVSILAEGANGALSRIGAVTGLARGEDIRAVRFDNERAYVVTFKKTDPLFVIDTLDPRSPKVLGELKIPGFSTYMHRIDAEHLLSIGFDANDHGDFAFFDGVILQLFDVKNGADPKLLHKEKIGTRGSSSEAATNHLAFNYLASRGLLAIPMTVCEGGGDGRDGDVLSFSGLIVYDVDVERGFTRLGGIDHGTKGVSCGTWWSHATSLVKRSVFLDDLVYSIADDRVKVQRLEHFGADLADLSL